MKMTREQEQALLDRFAERAMPVLLSAYVRDYGEGSAASVIDELSPRAQSSIARAAYDVATAMVEARDTLFGQVFFDEDDEEVITIKKIGRD